MSTVWAVNPTNDDISDAERYGEIRYVSAKYLFADEIDDERIPSPTDYSIDEAARRFNSERDYLLIVGDHLQLVAMAAKLSRYHSKFRVLRYDRKERAYFPVVVTCPPPLAAA